MERFTRPEFHFIRNTDELGGKKIAELSEQELADYLKSDSYKEENVKYRINENYILREIAGEYAIIPVNVEDSAFSNAVMAPNETAAFLWNAFQQPSTIQDVVIQGMLEYDVAEDTIRNSIENFVKQCLENKIIEKVEK